MKKSFLKVGMMLLIASMTMTSCQSFWDDLLGTEDNPSTPEAPAEDPESTEHEYVDLGLPSGVKWATCNVGAESPLENGNLYAWGETEPKTDYTASTYKFYADGNYTKYGAIDGKYRLESEDDVAQVLWGSEWRIPTYEELQELKENCTFTWVEEDGVGVVKATGPNGNFIYFPLPGNYTGSSIYFEGSVGSYWSSDLSYDSYAKDLDLEKNSQSLNGDIRYHGQAIRPVYGEAASDASDGVTITVEKVSDITEQLKQITSGIAAKGMEEYVVNIVSNGLTATSDDHTISVPKIEGSNINLNFVNALTTEVPLLVEAAETASAVSTEALNILTITMPESKGLSIELNMPETGVSLAAASGTVGYDEVVAIVAPVPNSYTYKPVIQSYIGNGIAIKNLQVNGGSVTMKDGASAETYVYAPAGNDAVLTLDYNDGKPLVPFHIANGTTDEYYPVLKEPIVNGVRNYPFSHIRIEKGNADYASVRCHNDPIEKITIAEGCTMKIVNGFPCVRFVEGEGEGAEMVILDSNPSTSYDENQTLWANGSSALYEIWEMRNITVSCEFTEESQEKLVGVAKENMRFGLGRVHANIENCILKFDYVTFITDQEVEAPNNLTHAPNPIIKDCRFISPGEGGKFSSPRIYITAPYQTSEIPSYTINFIDCTFWEGLESFQLSVLDSHSEYDYESSSWNTIYHTFSDYNVTFNIQNCKKGETLMNQPGFIWLYLSLPSGVNFLSEINGTSYIWDKNMPWDQTMQHWKQSTK